MCVCVCCREIKCRYWSRAVHVVPLLCLLPTSPPPTTVAPFLTRSLTSLPRQTGNTVVLRSRPVCVRVCVGWEGGGVQSQVWPENAIVQM